jgi:hypothetical protein
VVGQDVSAERDRWRLARDRLLQGPARPPEDVGRRDLPPDLAERAQQLADSAEFQLVMGDVPSDFGVLRLPSILSFQKLVFTDARQERFENVREGNLPSIFDVTIPLPREEVIEIMQDPSAGAYTISSLNPNLRIGGMAQVDVQVPVGTSGLALPKRLFGYHLTYGGRWVQAVNFQGRWFLRDGYHRAYRLLQRGITEAPCVLVFARSLEEVYGGRPGFISYDMMFGDRPARVADFVTDLAIDSTIPTMRKVIRVRVDEFQIIE